MLHKGTNGWYFCDINKSKSNQSSLAVNTNLIKIFIAYLDIYCLPRESVTGLDLHTIPTFICRRLRIGLQFPSVWPAARNELTSLPSLVSIAYFGTALATLGNSSSAVAYWVRFFLKECNVTDWPRENTRVRNLLLAILTGFSGVSLISPSECWDDSAAKACFLSHLYLSNYGHQRTLSIKRNKLRSKLPVQQRR